MVDVNTKFGGLLTKHGAAKKTNCDALGLPWKLTHMLLGDGGGENKVPNADQTALVREVYRAQLNALYVSPTDANVLVAEIIVPPDIGGWWIRELALEDDAGVFSAVGNCAPSYKPALAQGAGRNQIIRMHIITHSTNNIQLKIDPSVVLATRSFVEKTVTDAYNTLNSSKLNSANYTAADVLAKLLTVDGPGSGVEADLLDGQHGAYYLAWENLTGKPAPSVGEGQRWNDVKLSRASATIYTNTTGRPIQVGITISGGSNAATGTASIVVDGVEISSEESNGHSWTAPPFFIVPAGSTYKATWSGSSVYLRNWVELVELTHDLL